ncbi:MAG TPA: AMP-binding protein, partial [Candidatus Udaeobacter sp.]|nr:AMP-binding protein [Candidatus Udaeobacter sp.]
AAAEATHAIGDAHHLPLLDGARVARRPMLRLLSLDPDAGVPYWDQAQREFGSAEPPPPLAEPNDVAVLLFTSGTTGQAKGVMLSHANLLFNVEAVVRTLEFGPADRFLSILPLHHTFESMGGLLCPLRVGASVCTARRVASRELREDMSSSGATLFIGVPLLYEKLFAAIERAIDDAPPARRLIARALITISRLVRRLTGLRLGRALLPDLREASGLGHLRLLVCGAAALPEQVAWGFIDLGWAVLEGYGLTECSPVVAADSPHRPRPGAIGRPIAGVEVRIHEPDAEGHGEIVVRGPNVMLGYYGNPGATADVVKGGWFFTGDLGRIESGGRLRITGRLKNMIATAAGKKIYPEEIETQLAACPYILEVVVVGGRDARGEREEVHAHVFPDRARLEELARSTHATFDDAWVESTLKREIETRGLALAPYKRVKRVIVRKREFPKTATGKIQRLDIAAADSSDSGSESSPRVA